MNCSSLRSRAGRATIVSAMNAAGKMRRAPDSKDDAGRAATTHRERAPKKAIQPRAGARWRPGESAIRAREKINRSHRAAQNSSSIGKVFRPRFSAGMSFTQAIGVARQEQIRDSSRGRQRRTRGNDGSEERTRRDWITGRDARATQNREHARRRERGRCCSGERRARE
jgi:hypothetical protein